MKDVEGFSFSLKPYCEGCGDFYPDMESVEITACCDEFPKYLHVISCENAYKCSRIYERMKKQ